MKISISCLLAGVLFGCGLTVSQMINPAKVISFLDISGNWDPSLAFVMGAALTITSIGYRTVLKRKIPLLVDKFQLPSRGDADAKLIFGASIFGIGWGIAGLCPGPAIASISFGGNNSIIFVVTMTITIFIYRYINTKV
ncbi:MAG: YeeE/YedE family protein [Hellea sp.]|nr:YeeE/YedE family protein [Hellea sp.]